MPATTVMSAPPVYGGSSSSGGGQSSGSRRASCSSNSPKQSWSKWARSPAAGSRELPDTPPPQPPPRVVLFSDSDTLSSGGDGGTRRQSLPGHEQQDSQQSSHRLSVASPASRGFLTVAEDPSRMRRRSGGYGESFCLSDNRISNTNLDVASSASATLDCGGGGVRHRTLPSPLLSCDTSAVFGGGTGDHLLLSPRPHGFGVGSEAGSISSRALEVPRLRDLKSHSFPPPGGASDQESAGGRLMTSGGLGMTTTTTTATNNNSAGEKRKLWLSTRKFQTTSR